MNTNDTLLTALEAAELCRLSPSTLAHWRCRNRGPVWLKLGHLVRYSRSDIDEWLAEVAHPRNDGREPDGAKSSQEAPLRSQP